MQSEGYLAPLLKIFTVSVLLSPSRICGYLSSSNCTVHSSERRNRSVLSCGAGRRREERSIHQAASHQPLSSLFFSSFRLNRLEGPAAAAVPLPINNLKSSFSDSAALFAQQIGRGRTVCGAFYRSIEERQSHQSYFQLKVLYSARSSS